MLYKPVAWGFVLIVLVSLIGCTHAYSVKPFPIKPELVPDIRINDPITLINAQNYGTENVFYGGMGSKWVGDLGEWTDQAIGLLKFELTKRDVTIADDAAKTLRLMITQGKLDSEFSGIRCIVMLKATTGSGYTQKFEGNHINHSPFGEQARYHAGAGALTKAVTALLNDEKIIRYLQE
jgi:hypothetical protein